jgi:serine/threonine protein kinase/tetratricopeptide (TPR) repeat protein
VSKENSSAESAAPGAFGRYTLLEKIGQGGMAEVFRAKSFGVEGFEKVLVIKRILPQLAREPRFVEMFVREAKLAVRLSHANVVQVFDLGRVGDALFIAMEYVHGLDLATLLGWARRRGTQLAVSTAAYVAAEVAKGLDHAHRRRDEQLRPLGIVHRDVSPQNVLLSYEGEVKVTDFGIAKAKDTLGAEEDDAPRADGRIAIRGKYAYLSPEQANGATVDARSDIWALGVVMYEMLAGTNPFAAPTVFETLRRVRAAEAPPLELARPDVPREFSDILRRTLAQKPEERYPDAARLHDDLLAFLYSSGERFGAHPLSELLGSLRDTRELRVTTTRHGALEDSVDELEDGLARTPVEVPEASDVVTAAPRAATGSVVGVEGATGLARAASLGQYREVTALAIEIGFDASSTVDGTTLEAECSRVIERYAGQIHASGEGRVVAFFGLAVPDGRDADLAVRCALVLGRLLREVAPGSGIGIHVGRLTLDANGAIDGDDRLGALIAAVRELARAREGCVVISTAASRHVAQTVELEPLPPDARVLASTSGLLIKRRKPASETYAKFVGRREELRVVGEILAAATRKRARVLTLQGEPGIGKTRLLHEIARRLQRGAYDVGFYFASCPPHGRDQPLSAVAAMLRVLCGIEEGDAEPKVAALRPRLRALGLGDDELRTVLDLVREGGDARAPDSTAVQEHAVAAIAHMISKLCDDRLHALAWDDSQSMDPSSSIVLGQLARALAAQRVLFLFAGLPDEKLPIALPAESASDPRPVQHHVLVLPELRREDVQRILGTRLSARDVSPELLAFVEARTSGNPQYVEELLRAMQEAGAIEKITETGADGAPFVRAMLRDVGEAIDLPRSLRGLVASRLAKRSQKERAVLTAVALIGEPAEISVLAASAGEPVAELERLVSPLEEASIVRRVGERGIGFVSPLAREVILDASPAEAQRELHAAIAQALLALPHPPLDRVGHHLLEGGDRERAADAFRRSGEQHAAAGRAESAARDLSRSLVVGDLQGRAPGEVATTLKALAAVLVTSRGVGIGADAPLGLERALARVQGADEELRREAFIDAGRGFGGVSHFERAKEAFDQAEALCHGVERHLRKVLTARAELANRTGEFGEAASFLKRLEPMLGQGQAELLELYDAFVRLALATGATEGARGRDRALAYLHRAESLTARIGDTPARAAERTKTRGLILSFAHSLKEAAPEFERAAELAREAGLLYETAINLYNLGDTRIHLRDYPAAYAVLRQSRALAEEGGHDRLVAIVRAPLAYLDGIAGDANGRAKLVEIVAYSQQRGYPWDELNARYLLGLLYVRTGEKALAREELGRTRELAQQLSMAAMLHDCDLALAEVAE